MPEDWQRSGRTNTAEFNRWMASDGGSKPSGGARTGKRAAKGGIAEDLGMYFRSKWEANYARYLNWQKDRGEIAHWEYEPVTFDFRQWYLKGAIHYTPDFRLTYPDGRQEFVEVKGLMDGKSKTQLKRLAKHYPEASLRLVTKAEYLAIEQGLGKVIAHWE